MGDPQQGWEEIKQLLTKIAVWSLYIGMAVITKIAADSRKEQLSRRAIVIKVVLSIFVGAMAATFCEVNKYDEWSKIIVPVATLLGESIIVYIMTHSRQWIEQFLPPIMRKPKKDEK